MENLLRGPIQHFYFSIFFWWASLVFFEFLIFAGASYLLGGKALKALKIGFKYEGERAVYSTMLGYGLFGLFGASLAIFGIFNALYLRLFLAAVFLVSIKDVFYGAKYLRDWLGPGRIFDSLKSVFHEHAFLKTLLFIWIFANFLIAFHPVTGNDARVYHLPVMFDIINQEKFTFSETVDQFYAYIPVLAETVYAVPTAIFGNKSDPYVFQLIQYSALPLLLALLYFFLKNLVTNKLLHMAALFFTLGNFDFQREVLHAGYVDVLTLLFCIASSLLIIQAFGEANPHTNFGEVGVGASPSKKFLLSSIMLGLGLGMKYTAIFFGAINLLFLFVYFWNKRACFYDLSRILLRYGLVLLLISGFWYGKNLFVHGNPVYPMFSNPDFIGGIGWWVADRTFLNFFLFPFIRFGQWFVDDTQTSSQLFIFGLYALMYGGLLLLLLRRKKIGITTALLFLFVQIYTSILFFVSHQNRFLLPAGIMLAPLAAILSDKLSVMFYKISRPALVFLCLILFLGNFHYFGVKFLYLTGVYDRGQYILEIGGQ